MINTLGSIEPAIWNSPQSEGKWSPAQIAEHLRLTYSTLSAELAHTGGFRVLPKWWRLQIIRLFYLPRIIRTGKLPRNVRAPREIRPGDGPYDQSSSLMRLREEGETFLRDISAAMHDSSIRHLTHPYFGKVGLLDSLRYLTIHLRHHHDSLTGAT